MEKELQVEQVGDRGLFRVIGPPTALRGEQKLLNLMNEFKYLRFEKKPYVSPSLFDSIPIIDGIPNAEDSIIEVPLPTNTKQSFKTSIKLL